MSRARENTKANVEGTMAASVVASTVAFAVTMGIPFSRVTEVTGLTLIDLVDPDARLSSRCAPAIWRLLRKSFPDQAIPLRMADCIPPSFFGPLAHAVQHAATMRAALETLVRYRTILSPELQVTLAEMPGEVRLEIFHPADLEDHGWGSESALAIGTRFVREVMGVPGFLKRVEFAHEQAGPEDEYERFFGAPVLFNQASNALILHAEHLDRPLLRSDPRWFISLRSHLDVIRGRLSASAGPRGLETVRETIARCASRGAFTAAAVARESRMSLRTLQRFALAHGTTLHALIDEIKQARACQLLTDEKLSVDEIAILVGYSAEGAFRRAFMRWTRLTPARWRKENARDPC